MLGPGELDEAVFGQRGFPPGIEAALVGNRDLATRVAHHERELLCYRPWSSVTVRVS